MSTGILRSSISKRRPRLPVEMCEQGHSVDLAVGLGSPQVGRVVRNAEHVFGFLVDFVDYRAIDAVTEKSAEAVELPGSNRLFHLARVVLEQGDDVVAIAVSWSSGSRQAAGSGALANARDCALLACSNRMGSPHGGVGFRRIG